RGGLARRTGLSGTTRKHSPLPGLPARPGRPGAAGRASLSQGHRPLWKAPPPAGAPRLPVGLGGRGGPNGPCTPGERAGRGGGKSLPPGHRPGGTIGVVLSGRPRLPDIPDRELPGPGTLAFAERASGRGRGPHTVGRRGRPETRGGGARSDPGPYG